MRRSVNPSMFLLSMQVGNWDEDATIFNLLMCDKQDTLKHIEHELFDAVASGYEETKKFFEKYKIHDEELYLSSENEFKEMYRGMKFQTYIEQFDYKFGTGLYIVQ